MPFAFADVEIDLDRVEVTRAGEPVPVQPQVFAVIEYLLARRERVVSKEELLDNVWGDRFVSESALTSRIKSARRALGDDGVSQAVIRTVHGRGYRFVADVADVAVTAADGRRTGPARVDGSEPGGRGGSGPTNDEPDRPWPLTGRSDALGRVMDALDSASGAILTGPDGIGKSEVLAVIAGRLRDDGVQVDVVRGADPRVPLSALSHLLPDDLIDTELADGEIARSAWFHRARSLLDSVDRRVVVVDDLDRVDPMSDAVLAHLVGSSAIAVVVAGRAVVTGSSLLRLADTELLERVELSPLDEADVDALLYRRLGGPVDLDSLRELARLTRGVPGVLVDLVDASVASGALRTADGVWQLLGHPSSSRAEAWPPDDIAASARRGAERLALLEHVPLAAADALLGTGVADELDDMGLIAVERSAGDGIVVRLADPVLAAAVIDAIPALRAHRVRDELLELVSSSSLPPSTVAAVVRWDDDEMLSPALRVGAACDAVRRGDLRSASVLIDGLDPVADPSIAVVAAELAVSRGQHDVADRLLADLDLDRIVDEHVAVSALRRRAGIDALVRGRPDEALDRLESLSSQYDGPIRDGLVSMTATLLAQVHRYDAVLELVDSVGVVDERAAAEMALARAFAWSGKGRFHESNAAISDFESLAEQLPVPVADELRDTSLVLTTTSAQQLGDIALASALRRRMVPSGKVTRFGFAPVVGADIELAAGRPRAAREVLRPVRSVQIRNLYPQYEGVVEAQLARVAVALGDPVNARRHLERAEAAVDRSFGAARARVLAWAADARVSLSMSTAVLGLDDFAERSRGAGALLSELETRCAAVLADPSPAAARRHLARVEELAANFDGDLWPVRIDHVRARAELAPLDDVAARYRALGFELLASRADAGR